jgi:hypothetical protein
MSNAAVFVLINNEGKQDKILLATDILSARLREIVRIRSNDPTISDPSPTILDIEKSHILFTHAHFKPYAAIGFEYSKTSAQSGNVSLGSEITFSIPQFGDFFHDMIAYVKLRNPTMTIEASNDSDKPLMRWCPFPGERIFKTVEFEVNGNPLDKYNDFEVNKYRQFCIPVNKRLGWARCMGQEEPETGFFDQPNWANSGVAPTAINHRVAFTSHSGDQTPTGQKSVVVYKELLVPLLFWFNKDVRLSIPSISIPFGQRFIKVNLASGDELVNLVPRGASTYASPGGSLNYDNMLKSVELYINNIFVNPDIHDIFIARIGFTLIRVHKQQNIPIDQPTSELLLQQLKWPIESLYVGAKLRDYTSTDATLRRQHLDKWDVFNQVVDTSRTVQGFRSAKLKLKNSAYAIVASTLNNNGTSTHNVTLVTTAAASGTEGTVAYPGISSGDVLVFSLTPTNTVTNLVTQNVTLTLEVSQVLPELSDGTTDVKSQIIFKQLVSEISGLTGMPAGAVSLTTSATPVVYRADSAELSATVPVQNKLFDNITIKAHGIALYNNLMHDFYNAYLPYHYGGANLSTPEDRGLIFIPFNLYPLSYQPSGHINISRAREFYIEYVSSTISTSTPATLYVMGDAINFLLISSGSAVLRYTT